MAPFFFHLTGIGMTLPNAQAGAIGPFPRAAGAAAALLGFIQMIVAAGVGYALGQIGTTSTLPMCAMILAMSLLLVASYWLVVRPAEREI
jgi:DHA1 family bicyclomycin/chloramphenicol resistance-like MFS transporter